MLNIFFEHILAKKVSLVKLTCQTFILLILLIVVIITNSSLLTVHAQTDSLTTSHASQEESNLTVTPPFINLTTDPGVAVSSQFNVKNNSSTSKETLKFSIVKFSANETGDKPKFEPVTKDDEFVKWISFSQGQFILEPEEERTIKFTVTPSRQAALGYYYGVVVERVKKSSLEATNTINPEGLASFLVVLEVRNLQKAIKKLSLIDLQTSSPWYEYLPPILNIKFSNTGNIHLIPSGDIFIDSWTGQKDIGVVPVNPARGNILPGTVRTYQSTWDDSFITRVPKLNNEMVIKDAKGNVVYETKFNWEKITKFRIGKYTAHMLAVYDNGQNDIPIEATVSFWIIPWKIILALLVTLTASLFGVRFASKSVIKRLKKVSRR